MSPMRLPSPDPAPVIPVKKKKKATKAPVKAHARVSLSPKKAFATPPMSPASAASNGDGAKRRIPPPAKVIKVRRGVAPECGVESEGPSPDVATERICGQLDNGLRAMNRRMELMDVRLEALVDDTRRYQELMGSMLERVIHSTSGTDRALQCVMALHRELVPPHVRQQYAHGPKHQHQQQQQHQHQRALVPGAWMGPMGNDDEDDDDDDDESQIPGYGRMA